MEKLTPKNYIEAHRRRKNKFVRFSMNKNMCLIIVSVLMVILMSNLVLGANFDNVKSFDKDVGDYGKVTIDNWFGLGSTLETLELKKNTWECGISCSSETEIIIYNDGALIDDVRFMTKQATGGWKEEPIDSYNFYIKTGTEEYDVDDYTYPCKETINETICTRTYSGTHKETRDVWKEYNLKEEVVAGIFLVKLEGKKKFDRTVDWQITSQGKLIDEFAVWSDSIEVGLQAYYDFQTGTGTTAFDRLSGNFPGTLENGASWNVTGILGGALQLDGVNDILNISVQIGDAITGMDNFTLNYWYNIKSFDTNFEITSKDNPINDWRTTGNINNWEIRLFDAGGDIIRCTTATIVAGLGIWDNDPQWKMLTYVWDGGLNPDSLKMYSNGTHIPCETAVEVGTFDGLADSNVNIIVGKGDNGAFSGQFDEYGIWERVLTDAEVIDLYNEGIGIFLGSAVNLISPTNNSFSIDIIQNFTATVTPNFENSLANATIFVWDSIGTIVNETTTNLEGIVVNTSNFSISNLPAEVLTWNVLGCFNDSSSVTCEFADNNRTLKYGLNQIFEKFNGTVIETSSQNFILNLDILGGFNIQKASLIYNNTIFSSATITGSGINFNISRAITIPQGSQGFSSENRSFAFNVTLANDISGTTTHFLIGENEQKVNELTFGFCDGLDLDVPMLNFTMVNELTNIELNASKNATTFQATFVLGLDAENQIKNLSFNNISENVSRFNFCTEETTNVFTVNMNAFYTADGFVDKNHFLTGAVLSNNTNEITLFMLPEDTGVEFFIDVEEDLFPLTGATINIAKFFVGEGVFKTTEIDVTDGDGRITSFLDLNKDYRFTIVKDGVLLAILEKRAICEAAPCTLTLSITGDTPDIYSGFNEIFAQQVLYNLSYNPANKRVTFEFVDITGLATSFRMDIRKGLSNGTGTLISTQTLFTSSGSMTFNHTETQGDFTANILISRSPNQLIDFIKYIIADNSIVLGVLGLFVAFLIVITIIFGFAFSPTMLILAIPLSLSLTKLMQIISISNGAIVVIYLLSFVAIGFMSR